jgi:type IV pilus assembly protein PilW
MVEMMIAIALAMFLTAAAALVAVNSKAVFRSSDSVASVEDNSRFALDAFTSDVRGAGFAGCAGGASVPVSILNGVGFQYAYSPGISGFHAGLLGSWTPALDVSISGLVPAPTAGTDVLTLRAVTDNPQALIKSMASSTDNLTVSAGGPYHVGDILMVANCSRSAVFQVTSDPSNGVIVHATGGPLPGNTTNDLGASFAKEAAVLRLVSHTYYVAPSAIHPGASSLWLYSTPNYSGGANPQEIVEGVQGAVYLFGEDTDGDGVPNHYVTADLVGVWTNVVAIRVQLLMQSVRDGVTTAPVAYTFPAGGTSVTPTDRRLRSVVNSTISIRNLTP